MEKDKKNEDKEINELVLKLISKLQTKGVVGINRVIGEYNVRFMFGKEIGSKKEGTATDIGDALSHMGDDITHTLLGK